MRILVNENDYTELTQEEALYYFEDDADILMDLKTEDYTAWLYLKSEWIGEMIQCAVVKTDIEPQNIDEWLEDEWVFIEDKIRLVGD